MTLPVIVVLALLIGHLSGSTAGSTAHSSTAAPANGVLAPVTTAAPPADAAAEAPCTKVIEGLPVQLDGLNPRIVHSTPPSSFVEAWGDPAVVLRCGVAKPKDVHPGSSATFVLIAPADGSKGAYFDVTRSGDANVYTTVDRAVYIEITVPATYDGSPIPELAGVIAKALPVVCDGNGADLDTSKLCAERK